MFDFVKKFIKRWFRNFLGFLGLSYFYPGFQLGGGLSYFLTAGLLMTMVETFFEPLLKVLMIPLNVITFGMFSWLLTTIELLIVSLFIKFMEFIPFSFDSFIFLGIKVEAMEVNLVFSVIFGTIIFNLIVRIVKAIS